MAKAKRFYAYDTPQGKKWGARREYKTKQLRKKGFDTKAEAEQWLRDEMDRIDGKLPVAPIHSETLTTVKDALAIYKAELQSRAAGKGDSYTRHASSVIIKLTEFVKFVGADKPLRQVTPAEMRNWLQSMTADGLAKSTVRTHGGRLLGMFRAARRAGRSDLAGWESPYINLPRPARHEIHTGRVVNEDELNALLAALRNPEKTGRYNVLSHRQRTELWAEAADILVLLRWTGGRFSEISHLTVPQVDFNTRLVHLYATKTEHERFIPMNALIESVLRSRMAHGAFDGKHFFPRCTTRAHDCHLMSAIGKAAGTAGITYGRKMKGGFTAHSMRHTFITHLLNSGVEPTAVMELSGHKSYQSFSVYIHATPAGLEAARAVLEGVDGMLTGLPGKAGEAGIGGVSKTPPKHLQKRQLPPAARVRREA